MPGRKSRFLKFPWRSRVDIARDVDAELAFHLEMRVSELIAQGLGADEARQRARTDFGDIEFTKAYCRDVDARAERETRSADRLAELRQDVKYAWRTLRRSPGFAVVSLITLALAIGANTAIFTVTRAVLLRPLPYGAPGALMSVFENWPGHPIPVSHSPLSPPDYVDYRAAQRSFTDIAAVQPGSMTWQPANGDPGVFSAIHVTANFFNVLRVAPLHGRTFTTGDDAAGAAPKVVVSYHFWVHELGADVTKVDQPLILDGRSVQLIGVMPQGFTFGYNEDFWAPLDLSDDLKNAQVTRKQHWLAAVGRLKPGVTMETADADLGSIAHRLASSYPQADSGRIAFVIPLHDVVAGRVRTPILLLQGAALMVLLIACANLANLTLSRTMGRRREMALRAALGAGRARLVWQLLTESVLLALVGGAIGVALAVIATRALLALNPDMLPPLFAASVDGRVLLFSLALALGTGVLFGLLPALDAARTDLQDGLKEGGRGTSSGRAGGRVQRALVAVQVGLAVMLLIGAGLLLRSFGELTRVRLGFQPDHVLTAQVTASGDRYDSLPLRSLLFDRIIGAVGQSPGVVAAGAAMVLPMRGNMNTSLRVEGEVVDEANLPDLGYVSIRGDYFRAMGIPLVTGRVYNASDLPDGPKTGILNETAARRFFPKGDAIGRRIRIGPRPDGAWITIVGIVGDIRDQGLDLPTTPTLFANHVQEAWDATLSVVVRTTGDPHTAVPLLRRAVKGADPALAVKDIMSLADVVGSSLAARRFALALSACFAVVALLLAAVGIYGVLAYMVINRAREFGVRLALGGTTQSILMLVLRQGVGWSLFGLLLGMGGAVATGRLLSGMLYGVHAIDATTYAAVAVGLLIVVGAACVIPAARATRVDPLTSMRAE